MTKPIITRFAPSPTGSLHVGGARTALFNWAFARHHAGTFILRIEDTDQTRSTPESTRGILRDLQWLGLDWDHGPASPPPANDPAHHDFDPYKADQLGPHAPYFQSHRLQQGIYKQYLDQLLDAGRAYRCFKTKDQLDAERAAARKEKRTYKYDPTEALARSKAEADQLAEQGHPYVIRFRMPDAELIVNDLVLAELRFAPEQQEDFVIQKADGYPTYHFAVVVDDALMQVTHVIRGQEHLNNTPKHVALQDALGLERPEYAHIPLIFNADGSKMSKRDKAKAARKVAKEHLKTLDDPDAWIKGLCEHNEHLRKLVTPPAPAITAEQINTFLNADSDDIHIAELIALDLGIHLPEIEVADFRNAGYLPHVLCNYLALLGWSPGDDIERFGEDPLTFIKNKFTLDRVGKSNARFDREKLFRFNAEAIVTMDPAAFRHAVWKLPANNTQLINSNLFAGPDDPRFVAFCTAYQERSRTLREPLDNGRFFFINDIEVTFDDKAVRKNLDANDGDGRTVLAELAEKLAEIAESDWTLENIDAVVKQYAQQTDRKLGKVAQPLRVALTGNTVSPPIDQTLYLLGKESTLNRIQNCLNQPTPSQ